MFSLGWTDSSDSPGLGHDLTAAFVTELEEGLSIARGYNDSLHGTIIRWNAVQPECNPVVCVSTINWLTVAGFLRLGWNMLSIKVTAQKNKKQANKTAPIELVKT